VLGAGGRGRHAWVRLRPEEDDEGGEKNAPRRVLASPPPLVVGQGRSWSAVEGGAEDAQFLQLLGWNWMQVRSAAAAYLIGYLDAVPSL